MDNLEVTDRRKLIMRRKEEARYLRGQEKIAKRNLLEIYKLTEEKPDKFGYRAKTT